MVVVVVVVVVGVVRGPLGPAVCQQARKKLMLAIFLFQHGGAPMKFCIPTTPHQYCKSSILRIYQLQLHRHIYMHAQLKFMPRKVYNVSKWRQVLFRLIVYCTDRAYGCQML